MASWLMRMVSSCGKSTADGGRSAPGSRRSPTAGLAVVHADGLSTTRPVREPEPHLDRRPRRPVVPPHRLAVPRCAQASPALGGEQPAQRAIALSSRDIRGRRKFRPYQGILLSSANYGACPLPTNPIVPANLERCRGSHPFFLNRRRQTDSQTLPFVRHTYVSLLFLR
jgi:hypothetical protein